MRLRWPWHLELRLVSAVVMIGDTIIVDAVASTRDKPKRTWVEAVKRSGKRH